MIAKPSSKIRQGCTFSTKTKILAAFTLMVNNSNPTQKLMMHINQYVLKLPQLPWPPPQNGDDKAATRFIGTTPLWDLNLLKGIAQDSLTSTVQRIYPVTEDCNKDMAKEGISVSDVADFILQLRNEHYKNTMWCHTGTKTQVKAKPENLWFPCDAYSIDVLHDSGYGAYRMNLYLKMCANVKEELIFTVSIHS
jgi:hypothetical protein